MRLARRGAEREASDDLSDEGAVSAGGQPSGLPVVADGALGSGRVRAAPAGSRAIPCRQRMDVSVRRTNCSSAAVPTRELPDLSSSGDQTAMLQCFGTIATIPPPTPLFAGRPTR